MSEGFGIVVEVNNMSDRESIQSRALRRHQRQRMIARANSVADTMGIAEDRRSWWALRTYQHLAKCSCPMCGNPRRWFGQPTVQERRRADLRKEND
jgi:hypothetical protein